MSINKPYPKFYKLVLNSANARYYNGDFSFDVNIPLWDSLTTKVGWVLGVDSFFTSNTPAGITGTGGGLYGNLHLKELTQITSYSTDKKAQSDCILTFNSASVKNFLTINSVGLPIADENFFINKQFTLYFTDNSLNKVVVPSNTSFQVTILMWVNTE
jgi:hypothetical protein